MKQALRRFSSDKGTDLEDIRKSQEQLEEASEHNPIQAAGQRPTLSTQIRASFNKSGDSTLDAGCVQDSDQQLKV